MKRPRTPPACRVERRGHARRCSRRGGLRRSRCGRSGRRSRSAAAPSAVTGRRCARLHGGGRRRWQASAPESIARAGSHAPPAPTTSVARNTALTSRPVCRFGSGSAGGASRRMRDRRQRFAGKCAWMLGRRRGEAHRARRWKRRRRRDLRRALRRPRRDRDHAIGRPKAERGGERIERPREGSAISEKRFSGSFSRQRSMMRASASGMSGFSVRIGAGGSTSTRAQRAAPSSRRRRVFGR